jgi:hypothetical protein
VTAGATRNVHDRGCDLPSNPVEIEVCGLDFA